MHRLLLAAALSLPFASHASAAAPANVRTRYATVDVDGVDVFYREAGPRDAPTILLLHGFPSSSRMFEPLFARLGDRYHLVAPDYPGFGHSAAPPPERFAYTFDHLAAVVDRFSAKLGLDHYALYMQDYGGPVGFRVALAHPKRIDALIVQNAVAHAEGLGARWDKRRAFWSDRERYQDEVARALLAPEGFRERHVGRSPNAAFYDPDLWTDEIAMLSRPGQVRIQSDLMYDYRNNVAAYPAWQAYLREQRPPTLVVWGRHDPVFELAGAFAFARDVPDAEIHLLDAGHFALDEAADAIAHDIDAFLRRRAESAHAR
jgi:pimeloyl-ACP methyl ester carboxylesterase